MFAVEYCVYEPQVVVANQEPRTVVVMLWETQALVDVHQPLGEEVGVAALQTSYHCRNKA